MGDTQKGVSPTLAKRLSELSGIIDLDKQRSTTMVGYASVPLVSRMNSAKDPLEASAKIAP